MKIIDLLNKIANNKIPKKIKYDDYVYQWNNIIENYERKDDINTTLNWDYIAINCLNEEVEIIEEEKKIPEKIPLNYADDRKPEEVYEYLRCSYNQLIDYLKSKGDE